ncbi:hypothetical protein ElyMa_001058100 [Elysia marginata]|uniref:Transposase IS30-like HTH domain-containing protein n=1 Tax=Elysia marginata TaxID=1093978 RepID=A0AAV4HTQ1_9GAST|nr:hypothetical protein ElyMa_001058100 [Elysia marginata]
MPVVYSKICTADKTRIFQAYTRGENYIELARQIGFKRSTVHGIVPRALEHDGVVAFPRDGLRSVKMREEMLETVIALVNDHPGYTLIVINQELTVRLPDAPHCNIINNHQCTERTTRSNKHERAQRRAS